MKKNGQARALRMQPVDAAASGGSNRKIAMIVLAVAVCAPASAVVAHPLLESTSPPSDKVAGVSGIGRGSPAPMSITLDFSERVIAKFSGASIEDGEGRKIAAGPAATDLGDAKRLVIPLGSPLPPGRYSVDWHAVSDDTHRVKGRYSFTVPR